MKAFLKYYVRILRYTVSKYPVPFRIVLSTFIISILLGCNRKEVIEGDLILSNIQVVDVENGEIIPAQTVVVRGDTIYSISNYEASQELRAPTIVQGNEKYLIPGLWDMHIHQTGDQLMRSAFLPLYVAHGITGIREMSGLPEDFAMRDSIEQGLLLGPSVMLGSPLVNGLSTLNVGPHHLTIDSPEEAKATAERLHAQGYDFIKAYSFLSRESYWALMERARELGMEVSGHIPSDVSSFEAIKAGHKTIEHMIGLELSANREEETLRNKLRSMIQSIRKDTPEEVSMETFLALEYEPIPGIDPVKEDSLFQLIASSDTWVVPTLIRQMMISYPEDPRFHEDWFKPYIYFIQRDSAFEKYYKTRGRLKKVIDYRMQSLKRLHEKGGKILAGTDIQGGPALHVELELLVESGLSPLEALQTAILNPASYLGQSSDLGNISIGKVANLVVLDENPLLNIKNTRAINAVILRGYLIDQNQINAIKSTAVQALNEAERQYLISEL